jgi:hypothetical protein
LGIALITMEQLAKAKEIVFAEGIFDLWLCAWSAIWPHPPCRPTTGPACSSASCAPHWKPSVAPTAPS